MPRSPGTLCHTFCRPHCCMHCGTVYPTCPPARTHAHTHARIGRIVTAGAELLLVSLGFMHMSIRMSLHICMYMSMHRRELPFGASLAFTHMPIHMSAHVATQMCMHTSIYLQQAGVAVGCVAGVILSMCVLWDSKVTTYPYTHNHAHMFVCMSSHKSKHKS